MSVVVATSPSPGRTRLVIEYAHDVPQPTVSATSRCSRQLLDCVHALRLLL